MSIEQTMQLLGIQEVTTKKQSKNGTREFKLPIKDQHGKPIYVASFASGYVRRTKANGFSPSWQLNKTKKSTTPKPSSIALSEGFIQYRIERKTWT